MTEVCAHAAWLQAPSLDARSLSLRVKPSIEQLKLPEPLNMVVKLGMVICLAEFFFTNSLPHLKTHNFEEIISVIDFNVVQHYQLDSVTFIR